MERYKMVGQKSTLEQ